jgi:hypothetical protein
MQQLRIVNAKKLVLKHRFMLHSIVFVCFLFFVFFRLGISITHEPYRHVFISSASCGILNGTTVEGGVLKDLSACFVYFLSVMRAVADGN